MAKGSKYFRVWRETYGPTSECRFLGDVKPVDTPLSNLILTEVKRRMNDFLSADSRAVKLQMFLLDKQPYGEIYDIWEKKNTSGEFKRPSVKEGLGIMSFLAGNLKGRLLCNADDTKWMVVITSTASN